MSWLTAEEAAVRVGRGASTIRRWIGQGLPVVAGRIAEDKLLAFERTMRENRGRPRKVDPGAAVLAEVAAERAKQDAHWGEVDADANWSCFLQVRVFEVLSERECARLRVELVRLAAIAAGWVEAIDRRGTA